MLLVWVLVVVGAVIVLDDATGFTDDKDVPSHRRRNARAPPAPR
jgi:hypothetical protein